MHYYLPVTCPIFSITPADMPQQSQVTVRRKTPKPGRTSTKTSALPDTAADQDDLGGGDRVDETGTQPKHLFHTDQTNILMYYTADSAVLNLGQEISITITSYMSYIQHYSCRYATAMSSHREEEDTQSW
jgi:hypothetical protein